MNGEVYPQTCSDYTDGVSKGTIHEAKAKLASLIEEALSGEDVILMRRKKPPSRVAALPDIHKDPFDRLIVAQALHAGLSVLSSDAIFARYGVENLF